MPAAGYRIYYKSIFSVGSEGRYFSSSSDSANAGFAAHLNFTSSSIPPIANTKSGNGGSVRCLKNSPNSKTLTIHAN